MITDIAIHKVASQQTEAAYRQLAHLHQEQIDEGFLSSLGTKSLALLYSRLARSPHAVLYVATAQGERSPIVGFICGSIDTRQVYKYVLMGSWFMFLPALLPRLVSPVTVKKIFETLLYPVRHSPAPYIPKAEILNFCVSNAVQRCGVGRALFRTLMDDFRRKGITACRIVTGASQIKAQRFYEALNATRVATLEVHQGTRSVLYTYEIR